LIACGSLEIPWGDRQTGCRKAQQFIQEKEREAAGILEPKVIRTAAMIWDDLRFDEKVPHVRVRVTCAKNKKEEHVELVDPRELERAGKGTQAHERIVNALRERIAGLKEELG
jgi:hypothetical protein